MNARLNNGQMAQQPAKPDGVNHSYVYCEWNNPVV